MDYVAAIYTPVEGPQRWAVCCLTTKTWYFPILPNGKPSYGRDSAKRLARRLNKDLK